MKEDKEYRIVIDSEMKELESDYKKRNSKWSDITRNQLSYLNNFLLTLCVGFIAFSYKALKVVDLEFNFQDYCPYYTFLTISFIFMLIATGFGLYVIVTRFMDFRLTRQIIQDRYRLMKYFSIKVTDKKQNKYCWCCRTQIIFRVFEGNYPKIEIDDCKIIEQDKNKIEDIILKFNELRDLAHNLGLSTWKNTYLQIILFGFSLFFFGLSMIF